MSQCIYSSGPVTLETKISKNQLLLFLLSLSAFYYISFFSSPLCSPACHAPCSGSLSHFPFIAQPVLDYVAEILLPFISCFSISSSSDLSPLQNECLLLLKALLLPSSPIFSTIFLCQLLPFRYHFHNCPQQSEQTPG